MRTCIKNLFSSLLVFLFAVFGTVSAWSLPSNGHLLQYQFAAQKTAFQSIDLPFAARAPPLTGENVTFTGTQLMGMGDARAYDGVGVRWASLNLDADLDATNTTVFKATGSISVSGVRNIDKAQSYESGVRGLYRGASQADRSFTVVVDGKRVNGIADDITTIGGKSTAVDAKFAGDWATSLRNPNSVYGTKPWAVAEQQKMVTQAKNYEAAFDGGAVYHTNSTALAQHYSKAFKDAGITKFEFVVTPTK